MAKKKPPSGQRLKEIRRGLSTLKRAGLYKGDVKRAKGGWRQVKLLNTYRGVVKGEEKAVKVGTLKQAKTFPAELRPRNGRVVVPAKKSEHPRFNKKTKQIVKTVTRPGGEKVRTIILPQKVFSIADLPKAPKGRKYFYSVQFAQGQSARFSDPEELARLMQPYKERHRTPHGYAKFDQWLQAVIIEDMKANVNIPANPGRIFG
jgi:hypothetical protein